MTMPCTLLPPFPPAFWVNKKNVPIKHDAEWSLSSQHALEDAALQKQKQTNKNKKIKPQSKGDLKKKKLKQLPFFCTLNKIENIFVQIGKDSFL